MQPYKSKKAIRFAKSVDLFAAFSLFFGTTIGPALAQQAPPRIVIDQGAAGPHPTLDHTQNGLDQVNIAHPNGAGVSHNAFTEYGVKQNGIILNNAIHNTTTQTGGAIMGNPNLGGQSAHLILNEVTGNLPSRILGYTEVAGDRAAVVIANPNGITCSGCGFINTTRASLVTGHPEMDAQGNLHSFRIQDGTVSIEGNGGDFTTVPVLDILSRRVRLKAQLNANDVTIVAGRNRVDYGTNAVHPLEKDDSQKPEWAIDTAALGGLYAHNIYMVVNEAGAGVRVDGKMAANAGDMHLTANGDLVLNGTLAASGKMQASVQGSITNTGTWQSGQDLSVQSGTDFSNSGTINNQSGDITLQNSGQFANQGTIATPAGHLKITAGGDLSNQGAIGADENRVDLQAVSVNNNAGKIASRTGIAVQGEKGITNKGGQISTVSGTADILTSGDLDNSQGRILNSGDYLTLRAANVTNQGGAIQGNGTVKATLAGYDADKGGILSAGQDMALSVNGSLNNGGNIIAQTKDLTLQAGSLANSGIITAKTGLDLNAGGNSSNHGELSTASGEAKVIIGGDLDNSHGRILNSTGDLTLQAGALSNQGGAIQSQGALNATLNGYNSDTSSSVTSQKTLTVTSQNDVDNEGTMGGVAGTVLQAAGVTNGVKGQLLATNGDLVLSSASLKNEGVISTDKGRLTVTATGHASNDGQIIGSSQDVTFKAGALDNGQTGIITAKTGLDLNAGGNSSNHGELSTA
ncbi:filamentous hemagglutinin N-terminal domain-containing protein, partial [Acetobacteraceae bacterium ESL0697]|nr:filamentous hemagglutinin N-terminal domain-containing protein [Acetobacteraceae bacterium ESL0697]